VLPDTTDPSSAAGNPPAVPAADDPAVLTRWPDAADDDDIDDALADYYGWPDDLDAPMVRANMIASLDGSSTLDGRSAGLGNAQDERLFSILRDLADVILVGSGTVRAERYGGVILDARRRERRQRWGLSQTPPPIAVVTARGLDPESPLVTETDTPPVVITTEIAADRVPDGITKIITGHDRVNLSVAVSALGVAGHRRVHCEGGPALLGSLIADDLLDECCLTIAPLLLGERSTALVPVDLRDPVRWTLASAMVGGSHLFTRYRRAVAR
jgi:riboflavin biosynthesis pyrimidine reductase